MKRSICKMRIYMFIFSLFFVLSACVKVKEKAALIPEEDLNRVTSDFISEIPYFKVKKGKIFCSYEILGVSEKNDEVTQYLYVIAEEYYVENNELKSTVGRAYPVIVTIEKVGEQYKILNHTISKELEEEDAVSIFPKPVQKKMKSEEYINSRHEIGEKGKAKRIKKAKEYFSIK